MGGYRGDGYGVHGQYGDDDYEQETRQAREDMRDDRRERYEDRYDRERSRSRNEDRLMFGRSEDRSGLGPNDRDRDREREHGGRGFFERARDEAGSWFSDDHDRSDRDRESWRAANRYRQRFGMQGHEGQYGREPDENRGWARQDRSGGFSGSSQDQHYRSWRDRQMQELDRDYQDYCREREQQFHQDFGTWRSSRMASRTQGQAGESPGRESGTLTLNQPAGGASASAGTTAASTQQESEAAESGSERNSAGRGRSGS